MATAKNLSLVLLMVLMLDCVLLPAQCVINTSNNTPGITVINTNDTLTQGALYAQSFQIYIPVTYQGNVVDSVHLAVSGAPQGLTIQYLPEDNNGETIAGGGNGVICFSGVTYDTVGVYPLTFTGTAYTSAGSVAIGILTGNFSYTFYVRAPGLQGHSCDTVMNLSVAYDNAIVLPLTNTAEGFLSGNGAVNFQGTYYPFVAVAEKLTGGIGDTVTGAMAEFGYVTINAADSGKLVGFYVYDATGPLATGALTGGPGVVLDSAFISLKTIATDVQNHAFSGVTFASGARLPLPEFFIVIKLPEATGDTLVVYTNDATTNNGKGYLEINAWYPYTTAAGLSADSLGNFIGATVCGSTPNAPGPGFDALPASICQGTTVQFNNATTNNPTNFSWNFGDGTPGSSLLNPTHVFADTGAYLVSLTASNAGGTVTFSHYLKVHANPTATALITNATGLTNADGAVEVIVSGGMPPYTFSWSTGYRHDTLTGVAPGSYIVTVTDTNSCLVVDTFVVSYSNGLRALGDDVQLKLYPNPADDVLFIQSSAAITKLEVVTLLGQTVLVHNGTGNLLRLQTAGLAPGNYLVVVHTTGGVVKQVFCVGRE